MSAGTISKDRVRKSSSTLLSIEEIDFSDPHHVALAHSATGDGNHSIDVSVDLIDCRLTYQVDGEVVASLQCHDLNDLNEHLANLDFDEMIAFAEEQYKKQREQNRQPQQEQDDFSDIDPAAVRAALAESGIVDGHVVDPDKLAASPFIQQVMADVERIVADAPPPHERFSVIETENGYAIWDDIRDEIYVDGEGVQEEFASEWQAEDYLKQVRKDVEAKEAAEWLAVERAKQGISPQEQAEKEEKTGVENIASYQSGDERIVISKYPNGTYYNRYGYNEQRDFAAATAGGFDTFEEAEKALYSHRPKVEKVLESTEKEQESPIQPAPRRRAKVSPFVLHPEVPAADRHEYRITDDAIGVGTPGERFKNNIRAICLLKKLEAEDRFATPEEQTVLAQYVG